MTLRASHPIVLVTAPLIVASMLLRLSGYGFVTLFSPFQFTGGPLTAWGGAEHGALAQTVTPPLDANWRAPKQSDVNNLSKVINGTGIYGYIFTSSQNPPETAYGTYNWCNMPHVRREEYAAADEKYELRYVEVIHRHHKRTPYSANLFPENEAQWDCGDARMFRYSSPAEGGHATLPTYWSIEDSEGNPFARLPSVGSCEFPQLTRGGVDDAWVHGRDLYGVYHDLLHLIPDGGIENLASTVSFRVTNNVLTSQVASMVLGGFFGDSNVDSFPLRVERPGVDSLEPSYSCPKATQLYHSYGVGSRNQLWINHLEASQELFDRLDRVSHVQQDSRDWHQSWDHYFDNLSARLCHAKELLCEGSDCISPAEAEAVFRLGLYEYSYLYRDHPQSLEASSASFGVWPAQLANHLRDARSGADKLLYRHNVAHDGSLARLLSILQVEQMVWPGMGAEVVFELFRKAEDKPAEYKWFVRVLWGGQPLRSSSELGVMSMITLDDFLAYVDGLVGPSADAVREMCGS